MTTKRNGIAYLIIGVLLMTSGVVLLANAPTEQKQAYKYTVDTVPYQNVDDTATTIQANESNRLAVRMHDDLTTQNKGTIRVVAVIDEPSEQYASADYIEYRGLHYNVQRTDEAVTEMTRAIGYYMALFFFGGAFCFFGTIRVSETAAAILGLPWLLVTVGLMYFFPTILL